MCLGSKCVSDFDKMLTLTFIVLTALLSGANADPDGDKRNELKELRAKEVNLEKGSELKRKGPGE